MALHLGQIEIGTASTRDQFLRVVVKKQSKVEKAPGDWFAIDQHMLLRQMPAARPGHKHGDLLIELVLFSFGIGEINCAANGVAQIDLTFHHVPPGRRVRVFKIRHEDLCAGIQRVDNHLAIGRPGDFDPAVLDVARDRRTLPVAFADLFRLGQEVEPFALIKPSLPFLPALETLLAPRAEVTLQLCDKGERFRS